VRYAEGERELHRTVYPTHYGVAKALRASSSQPGIGLIGAIVLNDLDLSSIPPIPVVARPTGYFGMDSSPRGSRGSPLHIHHAPLMNPLRPEKGSLHAATSIGAIRPTGFSLHSAYISSLISTSPATMRRHGVSMCGRRPNGCPGAVVVVMAAVSATTRLVGSRWHAGKPMSAGPNCREADDALACAACRDGVFGHGTAPSRLTLPWYGNHRG